jgi:hypothetical protein
VRRCSLLILTLVFAIGLGPAPAAGAAAGWRQTFHTEFSGTAMPGQCWNYHGPHGGRAASAYRPDEVRVSGGMLRLGISERPYQGRQYSTGGMGCFNVAQVYGRYEFSAKAPLGKGIDAYIAVWPDNDEGDDAVLLEIIPRPGDEQLHVTNGYGGGHAGTVLRGTYSDRFHQYVIEWAPGSIRISIDGALRYSDSRASKQKRWLAFAVSSGDALTGLPDANTKLPAEFLIDRITISAYVPGAAPRTAAPPSKPAPAPPGSPSAEAAPAQAPAEARLEAADPVTQDTPDRTWLAWSVAGAAALVLLFAGVLVNRRFRAARPPGRHR